MEKLVTLQDLANSLNLDKSTVSRALRGSSRVSLATRNRVAARAAEMNYRPDPLLSALVERRRGTQVSDGRALAFLTVGKADFPVLHHGHLAGARRRASERGYHLEIFEYEDYGDGARISTVLWSRGICGLIVGPAQRFIENWGIDWRRFAAVVSGSAINPPPLDTVTQDEWQSMQLMFAEVEKRGYRRPGVFLQHHQPYHADDESRLSSAWYQLRKRGLEIPVLEAPYEYPHEQQAERVGDWVREHRIDVVLSNSVRGFYTLRDHIGWRVPEDVGFAAIRFHAMEEKIAGVHCRFDAIASAAVDLVDLLIRANERGLPEQPRKIYIPLAWEDGLTLLNKASTASSRRATRGRRGGRITAS